MWQHEIFCRQNVGWFASNWNPVYVRNSLKIAFWSFSPWGLQIFATKCTANAKKNRLSSETMPYRLLSVLASFTSWFYHFVTVVSLLTHRVLSVHIPGHQMNLHSCFAATLPPSPLCIPGTFDTRTIRCLQKSFLHFTCQELPLYSVGPRRPAQALMVFQDVSYRLQGGDRSTVLHSFCLTRNYWATRKLLSNHWLNQSLHQVYLRKSLCQKKVFITHCVLLQHSLQHSVIINVSITTSADHTLPYHAASFPRCALKSPERIV